MTHDKQWFIDRIGERIYRHNNICKCEVCMDVFKNGLIIHSKDMAQYLYDCQNQMGLIYSDKKLDTDKHQQRQ